MTNNNPIKIKILFFFMLFLTFQEAVKETWSDLLHKFSREIMGQDQINTVLRLNALIDKTEGLDEKTMHENLRNATFYQVGNKLSVFMFQAALNEEFFRGNAPDFDTANISRYYNISALSYIYNEIKQILRKVRRKEEVEQEDMEFLRSFVHEPWNVGVRDKELFIDLTEKAKYIFKKTSENPPEYTPLNIKQLACNVRDLPRGDFIIFIMKSVLELNSDHLCNLLNHKDDLVWFVIQSTKHKDLLSIFDLLKDILDGRDISDSAKKLKKLCDRSSPEILDLLYKRIVLGLIYGENKAKSIKQIANISEAMSFMSYLRKESIYDLILSLLRKNGHHRIGANKLVGDLKAENTLACTDLAQEVKRYFASFMPREGPLPAGRI